MMKNKKNIECDYSFEMLYKAAFGKSLPRHEKAKLQTLPQEKINGLVLDWAKKASWVVENKTGKDGIVYVAFHP